MKTIAHIENDLQTKFGVPRQSGIVNDLESRIVFEPEYRNPEALRGLEGFSHLWLLWDFSEAHREEWSPTVRPPRLGGNQRMGVFATRSPFRPNPIGLSSVRIKEIQPSTTNGPVIIVEGADLMNGTPIWDIKPYLPFTDSHPDAKGGFTDETNIQAPLEVQLSEEIIKRFSDQQIGVLRSILASDPRPRYHDNPERIYGIEFAGEDIKFKINENKVIVL